jgi:hypothetical protein
MDRLLRGYDRSIGFGDTSRDGCGLLAITHSIESLDNQVTIRPNNSLEPLERFGKPRKEIVVVSALCADSSHRLDATKNVL